WSWRAPEGTLCAGNDEGRAGRPERRGGPLRGGYRPGRGEAAGAVRPAPGGLAHIPPGARRGRGGDGHERSGWRVLLREQLVRAAAPLRGTCAGRASACGHAATTT